MEGWIDGWMDGWINGWSEKMHVYATTYVNSAHVHVCKEWGSWPQIITSYRDRTQYLAV